MQETKITLNGVEEKQLDPNQVYMIDWSRMSTVHDLILILASMGMAFPGNHPNIQALKPFLNLDKPIPMMGEAPKAEENKVELPKLKSLK